MLGTIILIVLLLALVGSLPAWPYSRGWGYYPGGIITILVIIAVFALATGRL